MILLWGIRPSLVTKTMSHPGLAQSADKVEKLQPARMSDPKKKKMHSVLIRGTRQGYFLKIF